jgi:pheromone a factor receptor
LHYANQPIRYLYRRYERTHYNFSHIGLIPAVEWTSDPFYKKSIDMIQWLFPARALVFFALFSSNEAQKPYRLAFWFQSALATIPL